jgi:hypothetical protein
MSAPPLAQRQTLVIARLVEHDQQRLPRRKFLQELLAESHAGGFVFARA